MVGFCLFSSQKTRLSRHPSGKRQLVLFRDIGFQLTYENVVAATGNFSVNNLIGSGGFGSTYRAEFTPNLQLAVKRLFLERLQGIQQFEAEVRTLEKVKHPNLVTLLGYHVSESHMFLVYNYLPGGNLESLIHDERRGMLNWNVRCHIALNVAEALVYLHDECTPRVLHRDIKPSNILLDKNLNAFLSDFGLARIVRSSETTMTDVKGTLGYVAPEYAWACRLSRKADVYSFGVVLLELLSGKRALDPSFSDCGHENNIVAWAYSMHMKGRFVDVFAPGLFENGSRKKLQGALKLALICTATNVTARPSMKEVVWYLKLLL